MRKWMPLEDPTRPDVWTDISNAVSTSRGTYRNAPGFNGSGTTATTPGTILSAWQGASVDGSLRTVVGTTTKLFLLSGGVFTNKSVAGGYTNTATAWSFVQYGNLSVATNGVDHPQYSDGVSAFANLPSGPTSAKIAAMQANALLLFNTNNGGNHYSTSDIGDYTNFTTGEAVVDNPILSRPGNITAAVAFGSDVIVFKESSCFRMSYVGLPAIWKVDLISDQHGAIGQGSVVSCGDTLVVCDFKNGAYAFDGSTFRRLDDGIKSFLVQLVLAPTASQYFRNQESVWFHIPTRTILQFNLSGNAWGRFTANTPSTQTLTNGAHVLMTGSGIFDAMRGATMIDPADTFPVLSSFAEDELLSGISDAISGYVTSSYTGQHGRTTSVSCVTPQLKVPDSVVGTTNVPTAASMTLTPFSSKTAEGTPTTEAAIACSTVAEKRFNMTLTRQWLKFKIAFTATPWEISDIGVASSDAGVSP